MLSTIVHRGPDADGLWADQRGRCVLGHRRLSIIDTSEAGRQPMVSHGGRWVITFNGEIYNFESVRSDLAAEGIAVRGRTDTEVLLESIALWGVDALSKLDGMFAFGAFNVESGELLLARDPFGEKPLYYMELPGGGLAFASELQALQQVPGFDPEVSIDAMAEVLMFQYIGAPRTIYKSVRKLPPGHWLSARPGEPLRLGRYFEFEPGISGFDRRPMADLADELEDILARSIRRRLISDVPLGAFLSGGVDSSTVCALVRKKLNLPLKTFSIGFENAPESEHEAARAFAQHLGTDHYDQVLTPHTSEFLLGIGKLLDEPNADSSCMPTYLLSEFARRHVTVALSGDGGDELFAGYGRYFATLDEELSSERSPGERYYSDRILVSTEKYVEELFGRVPDGLASHVARLRDEVNQPSGPLFCRLRKTDTDNYMPGAVLPKVDRMSMQHSLEVRTPFLNVELARFAEKLPLDVLYRKGKGKLLLREIAYRYLPRELIDMPKKGFGIPMSRWGREPLLDVASKLLENDDSRMRGALGSAAIDRFMKRQRRIGGFSTYQVWSIAMLESWLHHHPARLSQVDTGFGSRSGRKPLYAWPLSKQRFAVLEDPSIRLDDTVKSERQDPSRWSAILYNTLKLTLATEATDEAPDTANEVSGRILLPGWGDDPVTGDAMDALRGATLFFPEPEASQKIDFNEIRKLESFGIERLMFVHPHNYEGPLISLRLRRKNRLRRLRDALRLYRQRIAHIGISRARPPHSIRALRRESRAESYATGAISTIDAIGNTELSTRYMLFEGAYQLPPIPVSHEDIGSKGRGRYSVWEQHCLFSAAESPSALSFRQYWLVEKTKETEPYLDLVPELMDTGPRDVTAWIGAVREYIDKTNASPSTPLTEGDKIVVLTHALPPGGAERQWCYLAHGLQQAGYDVTFIVTDPLHGADAHYLPLLQRNNITVRHIRTQSLAEVASNLPADSAAAAILGGDGNPLRETLPMLVSLLRSIHPKAVVAQLDSTNLMAGVAAHLACVPCTVLSFRNYNPTYFPYLNNDWFLPLYRALAKSNRVLMSGNSKAGNADYAEWIGIPKEKVCFIPNAIDPGTIKRPHDEELHALRVELGIQPGEQVVLGVFRLSEEKRPLDFVEVCARLASSRSGIKAFIVGLGPLHERVEQEIAARGLQHVVTLLGRRNDVASLMHVSSLLLLTSSHEGMPNVVMEAQLIGLPVVATRVGGTPDLIVDRTTGYLCEVGDVQCLADQCEDILRNQASTSALTKIARQRLLGEFSVEALALRHVDLIRQHLERLPQALPNTVNHSRGEHVNR